MDNDYAQKRPASVQLVRLLHQKVWTALETDWHPGLVGLSALAFWCGGIKPWVTTYWELHVKFHFVSVVLSLNYQVNLSYESKFHVVHLLWR